jgi:hypothetical protein
MDRWNAAWAAALGGILFACGGSIATLDGNDGSAPGGSCPSELPTDKTPCDVLDLACEYGGTGDHLLCSTIAYCYSVPGGGNQWYVKPPWSGCIASQAQNPIGCPPSFTTLPVGATCPREPATQCIYDQGVCGCITCFADGGARSTEWACNEWPAPRGCPERRPRVGSPCTNEGDTCPYAIMCSVNDGEPPMECKNGRWVVQELSDACAIHACGM